MKVALCLFLLFLSALANAISSASSKHLEPVLNANLKFKPETAEVQRRREEQNRQPFPSSLVLTFDAYESSFSFDLEVFSEITQGASMTFYGENDAWVEEVPFQHKVYRGNKFNELGEKIGWINLVAHDDGLFEALIFENGELYSVTPISVHADELDAKSKRDLEAQSELVITKESDASESHKLCGVASPDQYANPLKNAEREASSSLESGLLTSYHPQGQINRNLLTVERWTDCFPNPNGATKRFDVFFYVDTGFYTAVGGTQAKAQDTILSIISQSNVIYLTQLNVFLFPGTVRVQTGLNGDLFNQVRGSCSDIQTTLTRFSAWRSTQDNENDGTYHLLTDCYPPPGVVGLAWLGVLCAKNAGTSNGAVVSGTGVSTMSSTTWKTVAHEIGHNFGAQHSFQEGQGTTGGIMDYGDGKLNGEFQFNSKYNKAEVCKEVSSSMVLTGSTIVKNCWKDLAPKCGNGVVEPGEECDDTTACCVSKTCKFISGGQCSSGPCCNNCQFAPTTTTCGNESYCVNGLCTPSLCATYSDLTFCGNKPNSCYEACILDGTTTCTPIDQFKTSAGVGLNGMVADGAVCNTAPYSVCQTGTCKASTFAWKVNNGTCNTKTCVSNATVVCLANNEIVVDDTLCTRNNAGDKPVVPACCVKSGQLGVAVGAGVGGAVVLLVVVILVFLYVRFQRAGVNQPKSAEAINVPRNIY